MECLCYLGSKAAEEQEIKLSGLWEFVSPSAVLFLSQDSILPSTGLISLIDTCEDLGHGIQSMEAEVIDIWFHSLVFRDKEPKVLSKWVI